MAIAVLAVCLAPPARAQASALSQFGTPTLYYDAKSKEPGAVVLTRIDSFKRLGLDLSLLAGATTKSTSLADTTGVAGLALTGTWTLPKTVYFVQGGAAITWKSGDQVSGGLIFTAGARF